MERLERACGKLGFHRRNTKPIGQSCHCWGLAPNFASPGDPPQKHAYWCPCAWTKDEWNRPSNPSKAE